MTDDRLVLLPVFVDDSEGIGITYLKSLGIDLYFNGFNEVASLVILI